MPVGEFVHEVLKMRRILMLKEALADNDKHQILKILTWFAFDDACVIDEDGDVDISEFECPAFNDYYAVRRQHMKKH